MKKRIPGFGLKEKWKKMEWEATYKWFLGVVDSDKGKIENLSKEGYNNWLLSLFYVAGIDKADVVMKKEKGVEAVKNTIRTAYHEAGHAVYNWLMGVGIGDNHIIIHPVQRRGVATIERAFHLVEEEGEEAMKRLVFGEPTDPDYDVLIDTYIAGYVAEDKLLRTFNLKPEGVDQDSPDYGNWDYMLNKKYPDDDVEQKRIRLAQHYKRVKKILDAPPRWRAVKQVAERLLLQAYVGREEFMEIINGIHLIKVKKPFVL